MTALSRGSALRLARHHRTDRRHIVALASRPRGVAHVYVGPTTRGGSVPRTCRPLCGARTRRLAVERTSLPALPPASKRLCRRCVGVLLPEPRQDLHAPIAREEWLAEFGSLTVFDLAIDAFMAERVEEIERIEFLALLLVGYPACATTPVVAPNGKVTPPLDAQLARHRVRIGAQHESPTGERLDFLVAEGMQRRKAERHEAYREREDRIRRHGFVNATN